MRSSLLILRTFCRNKATISPRSGYKKEVDYASSVVSTSFASQKRNERILENRKLQSLPFKVAKSGRLHLYFHKISKDYGSITKLKLLKKTVVVLNTADAVEQLFYLNRHTDGRPSPFFQHYVFKDKGFSFSDLTVAGVKQKQILEKCLYKQIFHSKDITIREIDGFISDLLEAGYSVNPDWFIHAFLSNVFCRVVSIIGLNT